MTIYLFFKIVHIVAVILFLGNIITGLFWMTRASQSKDRIIIAYTMGSIIRSDKWFTLPGVLLIVAGGIGAALYNHIPLLSTGWICWSIILFSVSGIAYSVRVAPLQQKIFDISNRSDSEEGDITYWNQFSLLYKSWKFWGMVALVTPLLSLLMMIAKRPAHTLVFW